MDNLFNEILKKIPNGYCRLGMNGNLAIKTSHGYKSYNVKTGRLVNCSNFVLPVGEDLFFIIPTNHVVKGDVIIANSEAKCVISVEKNEIKAINYENSTIETIVPERHIMMGNTYFYGKIVSIFGDNAFRTSKKGNKNMLNWLFMSSLLNNSGSENSNHNNEISVSENNNMLSGSIGDLLKAKMMFSMIQENGFNMFGDTFDFDFSDDESDDDNTVEEDEE